MTNMKNTQLSVKHLDLQKSWIPIFTGTYCENDNPKLDLKLIDLQNLKTPISVGDRGYTVKMKKCPTLCELDL